MSFFNGAETAHFNLQLKFTSPLKLKSTVWSVKDSPLSFWPGSEWREWWPIYSDHTAFCCDYFSHYWHPQVMDERLMILDGADLFSRSISREVNRKWPKSHFMLNCYRPLVYIYVNTGPEALPDIFFYIYNQIFKILI